MNEENIQQISRSTNEISNWFLQLLQNFGVADNWAKYINPIILLIVLAVLVFVIQYLTRFLLMNILSSFRII